MYDSSLIRERLESALFGPLGVGRLAAEHGTMRTDPPVFEAHRVVRDRGITPGEAAEITGQSRKTIYRQLRSGALEHVRVGRRYIISAAGLARAYGLDSDSPATPAGDPAPSGSEYRNAAVLTMAARALDLRARWESWARANGVDPLNPTRAEVEHFGDINSVDPIAVASLIGGGR